MTCQPLRSCPRAQSLSPLSQIDESTMQDFDAPSVFRRIGVSPSAIIDPYLRSHLLHDCLLVFSSSLRPAVELGGEARAPRGWAWRDGARAMAMAMASPGQRRRPSRCRRTAGERAFGCSRGSPTGSWPFCSLSLSAALRPKRRPNDGSPRSARNPARSAATPQKVTQSLSLREPPRRDRGAEAKQQKQTTIK